MDAPIAIAHPRLGNLLDPLHENSSLGRLSDPRIVPLDQCPHRENHATPADATYFFNSLLELLHLREIDLNQNFFDLGGDSLLAMQLIGRIRQQFDVDVPIRGLFETPTIEGLVRLIKVARENGAAPRRSKIAPPPKPSLDALAAELGKLSPEQIELL